MTRTPTPDRKSRGSTRTKMLVSAAEMLRERGAAGVTIDEVLARSGAPRGSVYHHFPEGRSQILREALEYAGYAITTAIDEAACENAGVLLRRYVQLWEDALITSDYTAGCPVLAAAIGSGEDEQQLTAVAGEIFSRWREASKQAYLREGFDAADASALADTTLSAMEGAVVLCRSVRSLQPLHDVAAQMEFLIKAKEFVKKFGVPTLNP
ncbi:TetR family transcriptional regulator [Mycolicibacterium aromaticivorans JS19b1 = JCM 16368]|uniref:TetR family transcriptional regulator n=1 Tax=Mycolicibacterium aromaticivorans JS19b1 = JCM 16368 TaxID=1440774 RepID=A0A064CIL7_9MYCO|nr:TetR/AcrR family transcriptional regulator [Mycolicibacterium aromaticivorans]KDF00166.1 TetR family transcriptional regulator [Mycolicibacterium aromaticivorans JS19b1 = JCM 16368]